MTDGASAIRGTQGVAAQARKKCIAAGDRSHHVLLSSPAAEPCFQV